MDVRGGAGAEPVLFQTCRYSGSPTLRVSWGYDV